jgi:hypothetical protein
LDFDKKEGHHIFKVPIYQSNRRRVKKSISMSMRISKEKY